LWINFAICVLLAIGLGFDTPTPGIMERKPRPASAPVVTRALGMRLLAAGLLAAVVTLIVAAYAEDQYNDQIAITMCLVTFSLTQIITAIETRDPERSALGMHTLANRRFNMMILAALGLTFLITELNFMQKIFDTTSLTSAQWGICLLAGLATFAIAEVAKIVLRRTGWASTSSVAPEQLQPQQLNRQDAQALP
jgi:P-type Ca2+ transporter type 2C